MKRQVVGCGEVLGEGSDTGGCQILIIEDEAGGSGTVIMSEGYDYGSWFGWIGRLNPEQMKTLRAFYRINDAQRWLSEQEGNELK